MNRKKYITIMLMLFLLGMNKTHAACTQQELDYFKKIEDKFTIDYEFNADKKRYDIYLKKIEPDKYYYRIYSSEKNKCIEYDNDIIKCTDMPLELYEIQIMSRTETCKEKMKSVFIDLSYYNKYSEDELCKGIEEFVLCNPSYSKKIEYEEFVSRVETYKRTKAEEEEKEPTDNKQNNIAEISDYVKENIISIIIIVIFIILLTITIIISVKSIRKSRRLE